MSEMTTVYVVPTGRLSIGDYAGVSMTADRVWFLERDTTVGFKDRREQLEAAYLDGFEIVMVEPGQDLPPEIAHHFASAEQNQRSY